MSAAAHESNNGKDGGELELHFEILSCVEEIDKFDLIGRKRLETLEASREMNVKVLKIMRSEVMRKALYICFFYTYS